MRCVTSCWAWLPVAGCQEVRRVIRTERRRRCMREPSSRRGSLDERIDAMTKRHLITTPFTPAARDVAWHVAAAFSF